MWIAKFGEYLFHERWTTMFDKHAINMSAFFRKYEFADQVDSGEFHSDV